MLAEKGIPFPSLSRVRLGLHISTMFAIFAGSTDRLVDPEDSRTGCGCISVRRAKGNSNSFEEQPNLAREPKQSRGRALAPEAALAKQRSLALMQLIQSAIAVREAALKTKAVDGDIHVVSQQSTFAWVMHTDRELGTELDREVLEEEQELTDARIDLDDMLRCAASELARAGDPLPAPADAPLQPN